MSEVKRFDLANLALGHFIEHGFSLEQTADEERVQQCIRAVGKTYLTPMLDPSRNDFTKKNHFWLVLSNETGPVLVGGARMDDLGNETVTDFWRRSMRRVYGAEIHNAVGQFSDLCDKRIGGRIVYFGDMFGTEVARKKPQLTRSFLLIAHLAAQVKWSPDVIYAFMREGDMDRGADRAYGFLNGIPNPQAWLLDAPHRDDSEWCVYNRKDEMDLAIESLARRIRKAVSRD